MNNAERILCRILRELAAERGLTLTPFADDWGHCLIHAAGRSRYVFGYDFDLNPAAAQLVARDKAATSDVLARHGVPRVEHVAFHHPTMAKFMPFAGNWAAMIDYAKRHAFDVVAKPNDGTGGVDVHRVRSQAKLELIVHGLFTRTKAIALSPFVDVRHEFRAVVLDGRCELAYEKLRPTATGDGRQTLAQLFAAAGGAVDAETNATRVPAAGESVPVNWRHNLGQGAGVRVIEPAELRDWRLDEIASRAMAALNLRFASVDVVIDMAGAPHVLEVNGGVMLEGFARLARDGYARAKAIYGGALGAMMQ